MLSWSLVDVDTTRWRGNAPSVLARRADVATEVWSGVATEAVLPLQVGVCGAPGWVADEHAETGLEGGDLAWLSGNIVNEDATVDLGAEVVVELSSEVK